MPTRSKLHAHGHASVQNDKRISVGRYCASAGQFELLDSQRNRKIAADIQAFKGLPIKRVGAKWRSLGNSEGWQATRTRSMHAGHLPQFIPLVSVDRQGDADLTTQAITRLGGADGQHTWWQLLILPHKVASLFEAKKNSNQKGDNSTTLYCGDFQASHFHVKLLSFQMQICAFSPAKI